ncbi:MAG: Smr/MutS family protein [Muribaculaceae bacterium]|nr:Smr/MutS family protein [Muribaculaceae bacterium]
MKQNSADIERKTAFDGVRQSISDLCISVLGADRCAEMQFSNDYDTISERLSQVAEMLAIIGGDDGFPIAGITDETGRLHSIRPGGTWLPAADVLRLRNSLSTMAAIEAFFRHKRDDQGHSPYPQLDRLAFMLDPFQNSIAAIDRIIDRWGNVKDNASPELSRIRSELSGMNGVIASTMRRVMARAVKDGYLDADTTPSVRDGRLVIPVAPMHKRRIPGIVHDESASGKTFFIEPSEIVEANNRLRELQIDERREIVRILIGLADVLRPEIDGMLHGFGLLGEFDFIHAKACYARDINATMPQLHREPQLEWYSARHPVLEAALHRSGKQIVPLDIRLTPEQRLLLVSGPNAGGKSVTLKTVAVVQYMLQCGVLPPVYDNSHFGVFENIMIDIGDDQSLEDDLSTYSSHLRNMRFFVANAGKSSLLLIDEFGSGTEPQIGGAIAQALLQRFVESGAYGVITSHFRNLIHFADSTEGMVNGSMLYDRNRMEPMFRLSVGHPGSSFAIDIARKTGLPADIIAKAEEIAGSDYVNFDRYLNDINRDRRYWENKRMSIRQKEKRIDDLLERYDSDAESLREQRRQIIADAREEARRILEGSNAAIERTIREIRSAQADRERTLELRRQLDAEKRQLAEDSASAAAGAHPLLKKADSALKRRRKPASATESRTAAEPESITVGTNVLLDGQGQPGRVLEISGKNATVAFGQLKTTVKLSRLQTTLRKPESGAGKRASFISADTTDRMRERQLQFRQEIDVRGMRVDEALQAVTYFIDDAIQFNSSRVRILHGTGTGALRQYIRNYLDGVAGVKNYHDEDVRLGGAGITVVEF